VKPDGWAQVSRLYHAALAQDANERGRFLAQACGDDDALRREVESLLAHEGTAEGFLAAPAMEVAAKVMAETSGGSLTGRQIGTYQIQSALGAGGMGDVYRARDRKLNRDVALKVLPAPFALDADRLARFKREAQILASLNHPNIAAIYGLEESNGVRALVLELVEGPTLADRIAKEPFAVSEALPIARQIAEALEAAHEHGIIHRDLKPANIKVRPDGTVKVLDFGLAKALEPAGSSPDDASQSPTITTPAMTGMGVILGTAAYMSPEQARGKTVDKRADVWAFGCVLYEMLTAQRAFGADDVASTLARVVEREPDFDALSPAVPARVRQALRVCLRKDPTQRVSDIRDVRLALEGAFETTAPQTAPTAPPAGRPLAWMAALAVATMLAAALAIPTVRHLREAPPPAPPETHVDLVTPATDQSASFALSPDGRQIVFVASGDGPSRLWLRSLATPTAQPLPGTEGARYPFWAPDGRSLGFFAAGALKRLDLGGGAPQTLAPANNGTGGAWNPDGVIVFAPTGTTTPLMRVSATGGSATAVTTLGPQQAGHVAPQFLPDGRRFLFAVRGAPDTAGIYLGGLDGSAPTRLTSVGSAGVSLPSGWLLWVRAGTLAAQRLDVAQAALTGEPVIVADEVDAVSVAATGLVAYRKSTSSQRQLTWVDRSGTVRGTVGDPDDMLSHPNVSPDGRRVLVSRRVQGNFDVWLLDGTRASRVTFDAARDGFPVWSPDGTRIVFQSSRTGPNDLYQKLTSGAGAEERLVASDQSKVPNSWSADGRFLLYHSISPQADADLWVLPMMGDRTPSVVLKTPFRETRGTFSPDGRWVAYQSNESGRHETYVRPFVPPGEAGTAAGAAAGQWQVSTAGGIMPVWRPDGKELYYLNPGGAMMAAPIAFTGATLAPGAPVVLFPTRIVGGGVDVQQGRQYDVARDGRFLINTELDGAVAPITLLQNWHPEVKK
jgi:Tol biopolymer transport system component